MPMAEHAIWFILAGVGCYAIWRADRIKALKPRLAQIDSFLGVLLVCASVSVWALRAMRIL